MPVYLKYDDIRGDVKEPAHRSWIDLESVSWDTKRPDRLPRGGEKGSLFTEIHATKKPDSASTLLFREALHGKAVEAFIDLVANDGSVYLRLEMKETLISSFQVSGGGPDAMESLTLSFTEIVMTPTPGTPPPKY